MTVPRPPGGRRRAPLRTRATKRLSHNDLENLVVALLAPESLAWPNPLYALGYRLRLFDSEISLLPAGPGTGGRPGPDAIAHHTGRNITLVLECKTGTDVGLYQLPEGRRDSVESWADATRIPRGGITPEPRFAGLLVAETEVLDPKRGEIERIKTSWLHAPRFVVDPDNLPDDRISTEVRKIKSSTWPRSFVPFGVDPTGDGEADRVVASIAKLIIDGASRGRDLLSAEDLARQTHAAVWDVSEKKKHASWAGAVAKALDGLASGSLAGLAVYDPIVRALRMTSIKSGQRADGRTLSDLRRVLASAHRKSQSKRRRVKKAESAALQIPLFEDDVFS